MIQVPQTWTEYVLKTSFCDPYAGVESDLLTFENDLKQAFSARGLLPLDEEQWKKYVWEILENETNSQVFDTNFAPVL